MITKAEATGVTQVAGMQLEARLGRLGFTPQQASDVALAVQEFFAEATPALLQLATPRITDAVLKDFQQSLENS